MDEGELEPYMSKFERTNPQKRLDCTLQGDTRLSQDNW